MTTTPWPKAICFFPSRLVARAGRLAAWHDMVTYLHPWWRCVAPPLPTIRLHAAAYLLSPMQAGGCGCGTHVCCVFALAYCPFSWLCVAPHACPARHAWRPRIPPYHFACSRRWLSRCTCGGIHGWAYLLLPFASYVSGRAGGGRALLCYAPWSPFTFVGAVAVLISCSLRSVSWHVTYLDPTSRVCMLCMFSFCLCAFMCVVLLPGGVWPLSCVLLSFVGFVFPRCAPSYHFAHRGGDDLAAIRACTYGHTFHSLCVRGWA